MVKTRAQTEMEASVLKELFDSMKADLNGMKNELKADNQCLSENVKSLKAENQCLSENVISLSENVNSKVESLNSKVESLKSELKTENESLVNKVQNYVDEKISCVQKDVNDVNVRISKVNESFNSEISKVNESFNSEISKINECFEKRLNAIEKVTTTQGPSSIGNSNVCNFNENVNVRSLSKPPLFDGQLSWSAFKTQFEVICRANCWSVNECACHLAASLRGPAVEILQSLPEENRLNYQSLIAALELRYGEAHMQQFHAIQLRNRQQRSGETLQELAAAIERLSRLAYAGCPTEVQDGLAQQHFVDSISDPEIQQSIRMADCKTLQAALVHGMKFETTRQASRGQRRMVRAATVTEDQDPETISNFIERLMATLQSFSSQRQPETRSHRPRCWKCGQEGHFQAQCRKPKPEKKSSSVSKQGNSN